MMNKRPKVAWIVTTVISLFAIIAGTYYSIRTKEQATESSAAADASLSFSPSVLTSATNTLLRPTVRLNPTTNHVTAFNIYIEFDKTKLDFESIELDPRFVELGNGSTISNANGFARISAGIRAPSTGAPVPITTTTTIATLSVRTKAVTGNTTVTFNSTDSKITATESDTSVLGSTQGLTITITSPASATPTASPTLVPTTAPTNSPTLAPTTVPTEDAYPAWDVDQNGVTNIIDIGLVTDNYDSANPSTPRADVNGDGTINVIDIGIVVDHYQ